MSWEEDFRRNIERTRQRIMEIAPDMLDLKAHHSAAGRPPPRTGAQSTRGARPCVSTSEPSFIARFRPTSDTPRATPVSPTDETSAVDPLRPGPYPTCRSAPTTVLHVERVPVQIVAHAPGTQISANMCASATKDCPLVVLFHARGDSTTYLSYEELSRHLASYGFVVVSVEWEPVTTYADKGLLLAPILESINSGLLGLIKILSDRLVLIGHSHGGFIVDRSANSGLSKTGFKLSAVVLMSPSEVTINSNTYADPLIDALLVLHDVIDQDPGANGGAPKDDPIPRPSGVLAYELAGHPNGGDVNSSNPQFVKHLTLVHNTFGSKCPSQLKGTHYYQGEAFARGYIASFLLAYVRGHTAYRSYFRRQKPMANLANVDTLDGIPGIWHMHAEPSEFVLIDWTSPMAMAIVEGAKELGPIALPEGDKYGLNHGRTFRVRFARGTQCVISIKFAPTTKMTEYDSIVLGLCQSNVAGYDPDVFWKGALAGTVSLVDAQKNQAYSVKLHEIGGAVWYRGCLKYYRRVCLEERLLPLSWAKDAVDLESVSQIVLRFDALDDFGHDAIAFVGNIKLVGKGP